MLWLLSCQQKPNTASQTFVPLEDGRWTINLHQAMGPQDVPVQKVIALVIGHLEFITIIIWTRRVVIDRVHLIGIGIVRTNSIGHCFVFRSKLSLPSTYNVNLTFGISMFQTNLFHIDMIMIGFPKVRFLVCKFYHFGLDMSRVKSVFMVDVMIESL